MLLAIDTAGTRCSACLFDLAGGRVLALADPDIGKGHAERLMDEVAGLLAGIGASYADLSKLAVVVGPGSFTGLRVGVAAVRGLSLALGIPAVGVGTLEALAEPHRDAGEAVLAVLDAKRGEVYAALHAPDGSEWRAPVACAPSDLPHLLASLGEGAPLTIAGSGAAIAEAALGALWPIRRDDRPHPGIAAVARIAAGREPGAAPRPLYLRGADAKPPARPPVARRADPGDAAGLSIFEESSV